MGPIRTYIVWATPSWRISAFVWVLAFGFYLMLPFWVDGWELFRCADGYSNVRAAQIWVPIFAAAALLYPIWRAVLHHYDDPGRRWLVMAVIACLGCAAIASVALGYVVLAEEYEPIDAGGGGVC